MPFAGIGDEQGTESDAQAGDQSKVEPSGSRLPPGSDGDLSTLAAAPSLGSAGRGLTSGHASQGEKHEQTGAGVSSWNTSITNIILVPLFVTKWLSDQQPSTLREV